MTVAIAQHQENGNGHQLVSIWSSHTSQTQTRSSLQNPAYAGASPSTIPGTGNNVKASRDPAGEKKIFQMDEKGQLPAVQRKYQTALELHRHANVCKGKKINLCFSTFPATRKVLSLTLTSSQ